MGGYNGSAPLDSIERIDSRDLLQVSPASSSTRNHQWTTLTCRVSTERDGCSAVAVHNRYIVVMGGIHNGSYLSTVDIIDTVVHIVMAGPSMNVPRARFTSAIVGHRIFVVGGRSKSAFLKGVEFLEFENASDKKETTETSTAQQVFPSPCAWCRSFRRTGWNLHYIRGCGILYYSQRGSGSDRMGYNSQPCLEAPTIRRGILRRHNGRSLKGYCHS